MPVVITIPAWPDKPNPCLVLQQLEQAWQSMLVNGTTTKIRFKTETGAEEEIQTSAAKPELLRAEIEKWRQLCADSLGIVSTTPRRFAARAR